MISKLIYSIKFGCELEFSTAFDDSKQFVKDSIHKVFGVNSLNIKKEVFKSINNKKWDLKLDPSTESELCTPISTWKKIDKICDVINLIKEKIKVTDNDALHVHVDMRNMDEKKILALWLKYEKIILSLFPKYRRESFFCERSIRKLKSGKNTASFFKDAMSATSDHHSAISFNLTEEGKKKRRTVEFRTAEGTKDPVMVRNWVLFCLSFVHASKKVNPFDILCDFPYDSSIDDLIVEIGIKDKDLLKWMESREKKFRKDK